MRQMEGHSRRATAGPPQFQDLLANLLPDRPFMSDVMDGFRGLPPDAKKLAAVWAAEVLERGDEPPEDTTIVAAQGIVALLPESSEAVLSSLRSPSDEVRFSIVVALDGVPRRTLRDLEAALVPAVWESATTSEDSSVQSMAVDFLSLVRRKTLRREIESRDLTCLSDFFLWSMRRDVFPRGKWPRSLGGEIYRRRAESG